jgi:hypothetical protein
MKAREFNEHRYGHNMSFGCPYEVSLDPKTSRINAVLHCFGPHSSLGFSKSYGRYWEVLGEEPREKHHIHTISYSSIAKPCHTSPP